MATYIERVNAVENFFTADIATIFNFTTPGPSTSFQIPAANTFRYAVIEFPRLSGTAYPKKELAYAETYAYVVSRSGSSNNSLSTGSFYYGIWLFGQDRYIDIGGSSSSWWRNLNSLNTNAYNLLRVHGDIEGGMSREEVFQTWSSRIGPAISVSANTVWRSNTNYIITARMLIQEYYQANPPYQIRTFIDAIPWVTSTIHEQGRYFSERQINTFTWDMEWNKAAVSAELKLASSIFKWRISGSTIENSINLGADVRYISIPIGTFPNQNIEWGVQVTTDDNVSSQFYWISLPHVKSAPIQILNLLPQSGFVNEKQAIVFSWGLAYQYSYYGDGNIVGGEIQIPIEQKYAIFQWRIPGAVNINSINISSSVTSITIPPNTFPDGHIEWRILQAVTTDGAIASNTDWFILTTIDQKPNKPTGLYPSTGSRDGTKNIQFSWLHNSPLSTPQSAFELQVTYDGGSTWKTFSNKIITTTTQFTAAANTIVPTDPTGRIGWRVRTFNSDNVASDWSDTAFFIVHPAPQRPNWISVEIGRARPLCRWTSLGQVGFQIHVKSGDAIIFDSGEIHGSETEYRITEFLNNGTFTFRIRIKNIRGLFSDWADRAVSINAPHRLDITLRGEAIENGAQLTFDVEVRASG